MTGNGFAKAIGVLASGALPLAAAIVVAGPSAADASTPQVSPVAGIPLQKSEEVAPNPHALIPDPVLNGSSAGGSVGSAVGSGGSLLGSAIGALVGVFRPDLVPQVLP
ncbi:hypothetical protein [Nocardia carnea]|uniref:hypothetical protein n=1 Tax=Nocardia carnea TaxID=37328 RepID=UPI002453F13D|nr:hypothetical protein [Nocardia carnea]